MRGGHRQNAGRKKGFAGLEAEKARELIVRRLIVEFAPIVDKAIEQAKEGNYRAREWLTERAYGKIRPDEESDFEPFIIKIINYGDVEHPLTPKTEVISNQ